MPQEKVPQLNVRGGKAPGGQEPQSMTARMPLGYRIPFQDLDLTGYRISNRNKKGLGMVQAYEKTRVCLSVGHALPR